MPDSERKSSEDLIREANERLHSGESELKQPSLDDRPHPEPASQPAREESNATQSKPRTDHPDVTTREDPPVGPVEEPRRSGLRWLRWGVIALVAVGVFVFARLGDVSRDDSGQIVGGGALDVMALQVGDCFNDAEEFEEVVVDVDAVPCSEAHDNEVFAVESVEGVFASDEFPGQTALQEHSYEACSGALFDSYVGTPYLESALDVFSFTPTSESWDQGDREFVCALYRVDLAELTGTARDSGL